MLFSRPRLGVLVVALATAPIGWALADGSESGPDLGRSLFEENCVPCHGAGATDGGGGDIRDMPFANVRRATGGIEQMPAFDLDDRQVDAIVAYLACLPEC